MKSELSPQPDDSPPAAAAEKVPANLDAQPRPKSEPAPPPPLRSKLEWAKYCWVHWRI